MSFEPDRQPFPGHCHFATIAFSIPGFYYRRIPQVIEFLDRIIKKMVVATARFKYHFLYKILFPHRGQTVHQLKISQTPP